MPSIEESKRQVMAGLNQLKPDVDHDAILANLQHEIDSFNDQSAEARRANDDHDRKRTRFRFKDSTSDRSSRLSRHRGKHNSMNGDARRQRKHRASTDAGTDAGTDADESAHPFPREPANINQAGQDDSSHAAFRESLFDALADDEGALYWESVYGQPIHTYPRPSVETPRGDLEQMDDDQYAAYVQTKMWEKKHPHIVQERERSEKRKREAEEATARERAEYVRRKRRAAWERAEEEGARKFARNDDVPEDTYEYVFDFEGKTNGASQRTLASTGASDYRRAWSVYLAAWNALKSELPPDARDSERGAEKLSERIPWPVLPSKLVVKTNIEAFMQHLPIGDGQSRLQLLKAERVRWHPDKVQQRFGSEVDEGSMRLVTGIFQVVDALVEQERKRVDV